MNLFKFLELVGNEFLLTASSRTKNHIINTYNTELKSKYPLVDIESPVEYINIANAKLDIKFNNRFYFEIEKHYPEALV
jgi:hypothetical protein